MNLKLRAKKQSAVKSITDSAEDIIVPVVAGGVIATMIPKGWALVTGIGLTVIGEHYQNNLVKLAGIGTTMASGTAYALTKNGTSGTEGTEGVDGIALTKSYFGNFLETVKSVIPASSNAVTVTVNKPANGFGETLLDYPASGMDETTAAGLEYTDYQPVGNMGTLGSLGTRMTTIQA
jgi:hypothetical protein